MKTEVYSWRLSGELKADLERQARRRKVPVSSILDNAVREWLQKNNDDGAGDEGQRRLHAAAARCFGTFAGDDPERADKAGDQVRRRLRRRYGR
jgi:predicted transcriptional regulator